MPDDKDAVDYLSEIYSEVPSEERQSIKPLAQLEDNEQVQKTRALKLANDAEEKRQKMLSEFVNKITPLFIRINAVVLGLLGFFLLLDFMFLAFSKTFQYQDRVIGETVMLALIAGSTTQVGVIAVSLSRYLFSVSNPIKNNKKEDTSPNVS